MERRLELGIDTFGDVTVDADGNAKHQAQVIRDVVDQAVLADQVGIDVFAIGEHHRDDFAVTSPDVVLAAIAGRTERIRLATAVTVLSSDDPVRVYERFATLDAVSGGRAEVVLGRGSFTESFPLFGYDLAQYGELFEEKLELFAALRADEPVTWSGTTRAPLVDARAFPAVEHGPLPTWVGVGGSPESVVRAARHGLPMMLAIIGGDAQRFVPHADLYRRALDELGSGPGALGVHSPGHVAATDDEAREQLWPHFKANRDRIGAERGWGPVSRTSFELEAGPRGALYVGSPDTVAAKIAATVRTLGLDRFELKYANGTMPHEQLLASIERFGTEVAPRVHDLLADADAA